MVKGLLNGKRFTFQSTPQCVSADYDKNLNLRT